MTVADKSAEKLLKAIHEFMEDIGFAHDYENDDYFVWEEKYDVRDFLSSLDSVEADLNYFVNGEGD